MDYVTFRNKEDAACKMQRLKAIGFIKEEDSGNPYFQNGIGRLSIQTDQGIRLPGIDHDQTVQPADCPCRKERKNRESNIHPGSHHDAS